MFPSKTVCFAGNPITGSIKKLLEDDEKSIVKKTALEQYIVSAIEMGYLCFIVDLSMEIGIWASEILQRLKARYPHIKLEAATPVDLKINDWDLSLRQKYDKLTAGCDLAHLIQKKYPLDFQTKINTYMVKKSGMIIAFSKYKSGEAGALLRYARSLGLIELIIKL